jgi:cyclohexa-1,5-dienecarbonyl-CoA hydratase
MTRKDKAAVDGPPVTLEYDQRRATLTLDRPPLNILDTEALEVLSAHLDKLRFDPDLQLLVIRGGGGQAFSAGVAVEDHTRDRIAESLRVFHKALRRLAALPAISIAAVQGHCLGGGMELAAACDFVLATSDSRFGQPEIDLGCFPPAAAAVYPDRLGYARTLDLLVTGDSLSAQEALGAGFVTWIAEGQLDAALEERSAKILSKSAPVTRALKSALHEGRRRLFENELQRTERAYLDEVLKTEDMDEGIAAFLEKRSPTWKHQ